MWITRSGKQFNSYVNGVVTKNWTADWSYGCQDVMIGSSEDGSKEFFPGQISKVAWCSGAHAAGCFPTPALTQLWTGAAGTAAGQSELIKMPNKEEVCKIYQGHENTLDISGDYAGGNLTGQPVMLSTAGCANAGPLLTMFSVGPLYGAQCNIGGPRHSTGSFPTGNFRMWITRSGKQFSSYVNGVLTKNWTAEWSYGCKDVFIGSEAESLASLFHGQISKVAWCTGANAAGCFPPTLPTNAALATD